MNNKNVKLASRSAATILKLSATTLLTFSAFTLSVTSTAAPVTDTRHSHPLSNNGSASHEYTQAHAKGHALGWKGNPHKQLVEEQTLQLASRMTEFRQASKSNKQQLKQELIAQAKARQELLKDLVKTDPQAAVRAVLPESARAGMPKDVLAMLTQKRELKGELEQSYVDYEDGSHSQLRHSLITENGSVDLHLAKGSKFEQLKTGAHIKVKGWMFKGSDIEQTESSALVLNDDSDSLQLLAATDVMSASASSLPNTIGEQRTLVILVNFQNNTSQPWTTAEVQEMVFGTVNDYYQEASYGQTWLSGVVQGYFTLPIDATCRTNDIDNYGRQAVIASGVDVSEYDRWVYIYPENSDCGWTGQGTIGGSPSRAFINGSMTLRTVGHELGHNFGLHHAKDYDCSEGVLTGRCMSFEYGDTMDIMGKSGVTGHFNAFSKQQLGWITPAAGGVVTAENDGSYLLEPYETLPAGNAKGLKVRRGTDADTGLPLWYYIEYRQAIGFDDFLAGKNGITDGVVFHLATENDMQSNLLIDMTPNSGIYDFDDAALLAGTSYTDPDAGVTITTEWADASGASVSVSYSGLSCVKASPSLSLQPNESAWVEAGTSVTYKATVTNNDSTGCAISDYNLSAVVPSGWAATQNSLSLAPGASSTVSLNVTSADTATDGFYDITITAVDSSDSEYAQTGIVSYVVDSPIEACVMASPRFILSVDNSGELAPGEAATYRGTITSQDSSSCASSDFDVTANVPAGWRADNLGVSLSPGESRNISLNVESSAVAQDGTYDFDMSATNRLDNRYSGNDIASYTVAKPLPTCTLAAPSIVASNPQGGEVAAGTQVSYSVTVTSHDSEACSEAAFALFADVPTGWSASSTRVTLAPGASTVVNISVTSDTKAEAGTFNIGLNAQNASEAEYLGKTSLSYTVKAAVNTAPVAVSDSVTMSSKTSVVIDVLANDWDAENDELTIVSVSQGAKGSVQINSNGQVIYSPAKSFKSSDSFSYTISDGDKTATASVSLSLASSGGGGNGHGNGKK
ncbi:NEW3 domain-containing protein [Shewanella schlegeliana]|uniref:Cadherin-like domain-containing protein n=1 Tax=Shewanella schlegeliana TaxID=190308 RepID=A0ABS1T2X7_9GAMM|nr:NEW3 domain-containing protein [Shewanella schlegeliana]MBL4915151.1 cadherin-like domain-containing protein [Shewanella schlegeliana]MCL1110981.1 NEW3 domain-containing protein [Shewanella schlegeliana]GIU29344.1 peptidase M11 [Shewanella schlegeliana]